MESNEQTELTRKIETGSQTESRIIAMGGGLGVEGLNEKEEGLMDMDNSVVIAVGERFIRGIWEKMQLKKRSPADSVRSTQDDLSFDYLNVTKVGTLLHIQNALIFAR